MAAVHIHVSEPRSSFSDDSGPVIEGDARKSGMWLHNE